MLEVLTVNTVSRFQILYINEEMGATTQLTLDNSKSKEWWGDYLDNKQICSRQREIRFLNVIFYRFCSKGTSEIVWFLEYFQQGFVWSSIFWVFKLSGVNWVYEFRIFFSSNLSNILQKQLRNWFFSLFLFIIGENRDILSKKI